MTSAATAPRPMIGSPASPHRGVHASLDLTFSRDPLTHRTVLADSRQLPPLKVVRAFSLADGSALAHLHNVSGGLLGGDELSMSVRAGPHASVQITTTGATRIYRPRELTEPASQHNEISVAEDALLEYVPDPVIPFASARYSQRTTIRLSDGAGLFWWEILAPGREARGEVFEYDSVQMKTDVLACGRPVVSERICLEPRARKLSELARLGPYRYWATFYICRVGLDPKNWLAAEHHLRNAAETLVIPGELILGISTLVAHGVVIRCLARRGSCVMSSLYALWSAAKKLLYDSDAIPPRKVR